jgi:purine-nucleoside phosphorylase
MDRLHGRVELAVVLGSGLSGIVNRHEVELCLPFEELPGLTASTAPGHPGKVILVRGLPLLLFLGRLHCYEGLSIGGAGCPARTAAELGCRRLLLTQAAGGLRRDPPIGSWMLADDIVSFSPALQGGDGWRRTAGSPRDLVSARFRKEIRSVARDRGIALRRGILFWTRGPAYETSSEALAALELGAAAASMSGLPELVTAREMGVEAAVLSLITNHAPSVHADPIDHEGVVREAARGLDALSALIDGLLELPQV